MQHFETLQKSTLDIPSGAVISVRRVAQTVGYDGHSLRAFNYFPERCGGIADTVESINSISDAYPDVRQDSKAPTFLLTYGGTYIGLMQNCGFSEVVAKSIESNYHKMYVASDNWVAAQIEEATKTGYVEAAFGLKVRTPLLARTILNNRATPIEAQKEARTAGNALGQSWGLLNNRCLTVFMRRVRTSKYSHSVRPIASIHDANYFLIKDDVDVVEWVNNNLTDEMRWQDHPAISHDDVKLSGELDLFFVDWSTSITLPNHASQSEIQQLCTEGIEKWRNQK